MSDYVLLNLFLWLNSRLFCEQLVELIRNNPAVPDVHIWTQAASIQTKQMNPKESRFSDGAMTVKSMWSTSSSYCFPSFFLSEFPQPAKPSKSWKPSAYFPAWGKIHLIYFPAHRLTFIPVPGRCQSNQRLSIRFVFSFIHKTPSPVVSNELASAAHFDFCDVGLHVGLCSFSKCC